MKFSQILTASAITAAAMAFTVIRPDEPAGLKIGDRAPLSSTEMKGTDEKSYTLDQLKGAKGLIVVFSCNTCPFVVGSESFAGWEQQYNSLHRQAKDAGIGFVLINSNEAKRSGDDSMAAMKTRASEKGYTMPYVVDEKSALANAFGAKTTPHVYFFNEKMELIYTGAIDNTVEGKREKDLHYLQDAIRSQATGAPVPVTTTPPRGCSIKRVS